MVTQKDIAKVAKVRQTTVSDVLNDRYGTKRISEEKRAYIKKIAREMGYVVDDMARAVKTGKSKTIGLISNNVPRKLMQSFLTTAEERDYSIRSFSVSEEYNIPIEARINSLKDTIRNHRLAGVIFHYSSRSINPLLDYLAEEDIPCMITSSTEDTRDSAVHFFSNDAQGGTLVAQHFLKQRYQRFVCIYDKKSYTECVRAISFTEMIEQQGFSVMQQAPIQDKNIDSAREFITTLEVERRKPVALFCATDSHALTVLTCALSMGVKVPGAISIVGYGDSTPSRLTIPQLSTVEEDFSGRGKEACKALIAMIKGGAKAKNKDFDVKLILRDSCMPLGVSLS